MAFNVKRAKNKDDGMFIMYHKKDQEKVNSFINKSKGKERTTYDLYINDDSPSNFETKKDAELWVQTARKEHFGYFRNTNKANIEIREKKSKPYVLGEHWREDFDYEGMINTGISVNNTWSIKELEALSDSYEDVNYHKENQPLYNAIISFKAGKKEEGNKYLAEFRALNRKAIKV